MFLNNTRSLISRYSFQVNETQLRRQTPFAHYKEVLHECHARQYTNGTTRAV